ncbi:LysR family transcriptional regulator [Paracoccus sp. S-4012]|uniref:winged helix-turn-helix domain-containing protein n=1 Tax=Paracoccus sp. S-4012 TaxID=2665648 RepID=UPI0012B080FE|nr:LysR family transcriptional regulator [Paracoccus sp. S-4012]MRX49990.1 LysR family transcriptional regulator [Paracoccus sp. S-4012]
MDDAPMANLHPEFFIRLYFSESGMMGPGKASLLEGIERTGSISAAGRELGMSYKRAWMLVEAMNAMFREPLVSSTRGGPGGGGAALTEAGEQVLALFRQIEATAVAANAAPLAELKGLLTDMPERK